ncbi:TonB-dependent receptor [Thalassotalea nanhaiensis]|uniref:TonB-dependent receptor n=1 Tax=Thalassotalea nanhaiensis TaxID=3065648 RepID=A0ABY9TJB6_9GAMM|nr:TonB-dependent receptor [Colwelliaceae bacterium SQ345]
MSRKYTSSRTSLAHPFHQSSLAKAVSAAIITSMISIPTFATEQEEEEVEVIVISATKKNETLQEAPIAITALTGDFIEAVHLSNVKELVKFTPGATGNSADSFLDALSIRGIRTEDYGSGGDMSNGLFKNDLYEGRTGSAVSSMYDMDRAEIVRGPQAFLFGRNSIGGAISVHTKRAEVGSSDGNISVDLGENNLVRVDGAINLDVSDTFAVRIAGLSHNEESYVDNLGPAGDIPDREITAFRLSTTYQPSDTLSIYTMIDYEERNQPGTAYRAVEEGEHWEMWDEIFGDQVNGGNGLKGGSADIDLDGGFYHKNYGTKDDAEALNIQIRVEKEFSFADLTVSAGYKDHDYFYAEDLDGGPLPIEDWKMDQSGDYTQVEARLNSKGNDALGWYFGASYYEESLDVYVENSFNEDILCDYYYSYYYDLGTSGCEELFNDYYGGYYGTFSHYREDHALVESVIHDGEFDGWAVYANLDYQITDTVNVEFGARHSSDSKEFSIDVPAPDSFLGAWWYYGFTTAEPIKDSKTWTDTSVKALIRWRPQDDMMFYASYTEGYKAGGFASFSLGTNAQGEDVPWQTYDLTNESGYPLETFAPETIDSYEIGYKDSFFEGNTDIALTAFYYDYGGLQVNASEPNTGATIVKNVGTTEAYGLEGTINTSLGEYWKLYLGLSYLDTEVTDLHDVCLGPTGQGEPGSDYCEGRPLYYAPELTGAFVLDGAFPLDSGAAITTSLEMYWEDERGGGWEYLPETELDATYTAAVRLGYESASNWWVQAYVDNVTDEEGYDNAYNGVGVVPAVHWSVFKPRTMGIRFGMSWD